MGYVSKMAAALWSAVAESLTLKVSDCKYMRCAGHFAFRAVNTRSGPQPTRRVKQVKPVKRSMDMKSALTKQLNRRRDLTHRTNLNTRLKPRIAVTEESVSRGRREIVIEPSCQNPAFTPGDNQIQVTSFHSLGIRGDVLKGLENLSITKPTVTQMTTIPPILKKEHVLCAAQTGTGKTLAYLLPIVHHLKEEHDQGLISRVKRPRVLIVVPSRELAFQVLKVAKSLSHNARFRSALLTGGRKLRILKSGLESPVDLLVGTPGTLLEFREKGRLFFSDVSYFVVDEADSMFDETFKSETIKLLETISVRQDKLVPRTSALPTDPVDAQVVVVGATLPKELVDALQDMLPERSNLFKDFQKEKARILLCTDVASRGLDTDVDHVINFDFPLKLTDYIHRVGRTGRVRAGTKDRDTAEATSLMTHNRDVRMALVIEEAAKSQRSVKSIEARVTQRWLNSRRTTKLTQRRGRHLRSSQAPGVRVRLRKPGQSSEEKSERLSNNKA
ncbi:uncharacterized protein [Montipora capricornis]|uniref:uncharacterized protein isoform X4 n=1 Tax=Montipora capricornis TaxID=246305 RepID=UPI0035F1ABA1